MRWDDVGDQTCSIARTLAVVGDRWTLLVLREAFGSARRFEQFQRRVGASRPSAMLVAAFSFEKVPVLEPGFVAGTVFFHGVVGIFGSDPLASSTASPARAATCSPCCWR